MQMSVAIGPYGSYDPVETPKPLWGSPGAELSTWTTFVKPLYTDTHCVTALHSYTAIQRYTALYSAIQRYTLYRYTSLYTIQPMQHPSGKELLQRVACLTSHHPLPNTDIDASTVFKFELSAPLEVTNADAWASHSSSLRAAPPLQRCSVRATSGGERKVTLFRDT